MGRRTSEGFSPLSSDPAPPTANAQTSVTANGRTGAIDGRNGCGDLSIRAYCWRPRVRAAWLVRSAQ